MMKQNAASDWPVWFKWAVQLLSLVVIIVVGPNLLRFWHQPADQPPRDFAQDWCSSRNWYEGEPIYSPLQVAIPRYIYQLKPDEVPYIKHNAHPPASVLVLLPLSRLTYAQALWIWQTINALALIAALLLVAQQLEIRITLWHILPTTAFLVLFDPVRHEFIQGNWNAILCLGVTLTWVLTRKHHDLAAGTVLGITAALKLYPAFLIFFFLAQRRWLAVLGLILSFVLMQLAAVTVLGWDAFVDYRRTMTEGLSDFQAVWTNGSLPGLAAKLFAPHSIAAVKLTPLVDAPWLVQAISITAFLLLTFFTSRFTFRATTLSMQDDAFALMLSACLLLSPLIWVDGILLLFMPGLLLWQRSQPWPRLRYYIAGLLWLLVSTQQWIIEWLKTRPLTEWTFQPGETLTYLNTLCYALLAFHLLQWYVLRCNNPGSTETSSLER